MAKRDLLDGTGKSALDIGCAYGFVISLLVRSGYRAFGIDVSDYALREGKGLGIEDVVHADATHLPFKTASFDLVTGFEVLEHIYDPESALLAISKVTKPGGVFLMTTPTVTPFAQIMTFLISREAGHVSMKSPKDWVVILKRAGFKTVKLQTYSFLPIPPTILHRYFTVDCDAMVGSNVRIVAQKDSN